MENRGLELSSHQPRTDLRTKTIALAITISMLPVLVAGIATYYFTSQSLEQIAEAKKVKTTEQKRLLLILLAGTQATAMLSAIFTLLWASRTISSKTNTTTAATIRGTRKKLKEHKQLFTDTTEHIHSSLSEEDIFKVAVRETRRAIDTDRVVVYSLDEQSQGRIIAESVADRWPRAKGATLHDPCIDALYSEKYRNGRVQVVDDIYSANLTPCHLSQLEPFAVKANLVAPILNQDKLLGLLIAHQCDRPRVWQQSEIELFAYIAKQVGLAIHNASLSRQLAQASQAILKIPAMAYSAGRIATKVQEVEPEILKSNQIVTAEKQAINSAIDELDSIRELMMESTIKTKRLTQFCQRNFQIVSLLKKLTLHRNQQTINTTIEASLFEDTAQEGAVSIAKKMHFSIEQLGTVIKEIESLTEEIETEANDLSASFTNGIKKMIGSTRSMEKIEQELNQAFVLNSRTIMLVSQIAQAVTEQVSTSTSISQYIEKIMNITS